jgi:hypothetical protein
LDTVNSLLSLTALGNIVSHDVPVRNTMIKKNIGPIPAERIHLTDFSKVLLRLNYFQPVTVAGSTII